MSRTVNSHSLMKEKSPLYQDLRNYDYMAPGEMELAYRVPENLVGRDLNNANKITANINLELMRD